MRGTIDQNTNSLYVTKDKSTGKMITVCLDTGEIVFNGHQLSDAVRYVYDKHIAQLICQKVREGKSLTAITSSPDFPDANVIAYWQKTHPEFAMELRLARQDRAEYYHDKVLEIADSDPMGRDAIAAAKFRADQYRWAAEKGDPSRYGNKTEVSGTVENKVSMIVLNTGIVRSRPDIEVDFKEKEQQDIIDVPVEVVDTDGKDDEPPF